MKHTTNDVLRMVGQLLLHHSTTGAMAKDKDGHTVSYVDPKANSFCLIGALHACSDKLLLHEDASPFWDVSLMLNVGVGYIHSTWDNLSAMQQQELSEKLTNITAP